jgi:hypothetical protein
VAASTDAERERVGRRAVRRGGPIAALAALADRLMTLAADQPWWCRLVG